MTIKYLSFNIYVGENSIDIQTLHARNELPPVWLRPVPPYYPLRLSHWNHPRHRLRVLRLRRRQVLVRPPPPRPLSSDGRDRGSGSGGAPVGADRSADRKGVAYHRVRDTDARGPDWAQQVRLAEPTQCGVHAVHRSGSGWRWWEVATWLLHDRTRSAAAVSTESAQSHRSILSCQIWTEGRLFISQSLGNSYQSHSLEGLYQSHSIEDHYQSQSLKDLYQSPSIEELYQSHSLEDLYQFHSFEHLYQLHPLESRIAWSFSNITHDSLNRSCNKKMIFGCLYSKIDIQKTCLERWTVEY